MRLDAHERQLLQLLLSALNVSEYTDTADTLSRRHEGARIVRGVQDMCAISTGLMTCTHLGKGEALVAKPLEENEEFFQEVRFSAMRIPIPLREHSRCGRSSVLCDDDDNDGRRRRRRRRR